MTEAIAKWISLHMLRILVYQEGGSVIVCIRHNRFEKHSVVMESAPKEFISLNGYGYENLESHPLLLPNTLKTAPKCECKRLVGIDEGTLNIL